MKRAVTNRISLLILGAAIAAIAACSDSGDPLVPAPSTLASTTHGGSTSGNGAASDSGKPSGGGTGQGGDTSVTHNPAPTPAPNFTLNVHVGTPRAGTSDTLANDPVALATVTLTQRTVVYTGRTGSDSVEFKDGDTQTLITTADGNVAFPSLKANTSYFITATPPAGSPLQAASQWIYYQGSSQSILINMLLRKP